ncbi:MAG: DUF2029 domain-containing protein, partial [Anaerolineae bacterium]|nr:DUF2029 domain-containing protein [Anaerolineae bacterium]NIO00196.1 DUF2029 domain-containing protein [Anaerolineae bacterium]
MELRLVWMLAVGIVIRLLIAPFTSWTDDVYPFYRATMDMAGGLDPYDTSFFTYPPVWAYILFPLFTIAGLIADPESFAVTVSSIGVTAEATGMLVPTVTSPLFNFILKLPLIGADVGIALLLYRWGSDSFGPKQGKTAFILWFLNPMVIWVNAVHGQFDVLPAFFIVASCLLLVRRRFVYAGVAFGLAILLKLY